MKENTIVSVRDPAVETCMFDEFWGRIEEHFGLKFSSSRHSDVREQLQRRARETGSGSTERYVRNFLSANHDDPEYAHWASILTINETYFFRNANDWSALRRHLLPEILRGNRHRKSLKVLSLGCATGEELYSMALMLRMFFPALAGWNVQLLAGDIDDAMLSIAREGGPYSARSMRQVDEETRRAHFTIRKGGWFVNDDLRSTTEFRHCNLLRIPDYAFLRQSDIIFCRNVLIYFDVPVAASVIRQIHGCLADGGYLIIGHSEAVLAEQAGCATTIISGCIALSKGGAAGEAERAACARPGPAAETRDDAAGDEGPAWLPVEETLDHAQQLIDLGRLGDARVMLDGALLRAPASLRAHYLLGLLHEHAGTLQPAIGEFEHALRIDPDDIMSRFQVAMLCRRAGDGAAAEMHFGALRRLLATRPHDAYVDREQQLTIGFLSLLCQNLCARPSGA